MKKIIILSVFSLFALIALCQAPDAFQYQAVISDNGASLVEKDVTVRFTVRENTTTGAKVFSETHQAKTNKFGLVSLPIGKGTAIDGTFSAINWAKGTYFIETEVDKGAGFVPTGTQQLMSVPYAKYADNAGEIILESASGKRFSVTIDEQGNLSTQEIITE